MNGHHETRSLGSCDKMKLRRTRRGLGVGPYALVELAGWPLSMALAVDPGVAPPFILGESLLLLLLLHTLLPADLLLSRSCDLFSQGCMGASFAGKESSVSFFLLQFFFRHLII